jgi:hypothetical protein
MRLMDFSQIPLELDPEACTTAFIRDVVIAESDGCFVRRARTFVATAVLDFAAN